MSVTLILGQMLGNLINLIITQARSCMAAEMVITSQKSTTKTVKTIKEIGNINTVVTILKVLVGINLHLNIFCLISKNKFHIWNLGLHLLERI